MIFRRTLAIILVILSIAFTIYIIDEGTLNVFTIFIWAALSFPILILFNYDTKAAKRLRGLQNKDKEKRALHPKKWF